MVRRPSVWCKLSGMVAEIGRGWRQADLAPFARVVLDCFGPAGCMWGADWPVVALASECQGWLDAACARTDHLAPHEQELPFAGMTRDFYGQVA